MLFNQRFGVLACTSMMCRSIYVRATKKTIAESLQDSSSTGPQQIRFGEISWKPQIQTQTMASVVRSRRGQGKAETDRAVLSRRGRGPLFLLSSSLRPGRRPASRGASDGLPARSACDRTARGRPGNSGCGAAVHAHHYLLSSVDDRQRVKLNKDAWVRA